MLTLTYRLDDFSCAHRLVKGYQGKCAHLHGHNYRIEATLCSTELDKIDMMVDFATIKEVCNAWINRELDHGTLVSSEDPELLTFVVDHKQKHYLLKGVNTTLECLAKNIKAKLSALLAKHEAFGDTVMLDSITVWETEKASISC